MFRAMTTASLLLVAPMTLAQAVDLRGPAPSAGESYMTYVDMEATDGELTINFQGQEMVGDLEIVGHTEERLEIREVADGKVVSAISEIMDNETVTNVNIMGQQQEDVEGTDQIGLRVHYQRQEDDSWDNKISGGEDTNLDGTDYLTSIPFLHPNDIYPEHAVEPGDSWALEGDQLVVLFDLAEMETDTVEGEAVMTLVSVEQINGVRYANITLEGEVTFTGEVDEEGMVGDATTTIEMEGEILRSLETFVDEETQIQANMHMVLDSKDISMEMEMDLEIVSETERQ